MRRVLLAVAVVSVVMVPASLMLAVPGFATPTTTAPGIVYDLPVILTNTSITIKRDRNTLTTGLHTFPRGAIIRFNFKNEGTKTVGAKLVLLSQHVFSKFETKRTSLTVKPIAPQGTGHLLANFYFRGSFKLELTVNGHPGPSAQILVY